MKEQLSTLDQARARLKLADLGWDHSEHDHLVRRDAELLDEMASTR